MMKQILTKGTASIYEFEILSIKIGFPRKEVKYYWADDAMEQSPRLQGPFNTDIEAINDHEQRLKEFKRVYLE